MKQEKMDKCIICGKESDDMIGFQISKDFSFFICDDCLDYLQKGGKIAKYVEQSATYGEELNKAISEWLDYKKGRKEGYSEKGQKALMTRISNEVKETGEKCVAIKIRNTISHNWQGIAWDVGIVPDEKIEYWFNMTFALCKNNEGKAEALRNYKILFKHFDNEEDAHKRAVYIYKVFKGYIDKLTDPKYCKTFLRWLKAEIPNDWWD